MNKVTSITAIAFMIFALTLEGNTANGHTQAKSIYGWNIAQSRIALNHNETIVRDLALVQQPNVLSRLLTTIQSFFVSRPKPGGCDEWGCGANHNETMVHDLALVQPTSALSRFLTAIQSFFVSRPKPGDYDEFGVGMNHNETMVRDLALVQPTSALSRFLTTIQSFFVSKPKPRGL